MKEGDKLDKIVSFIFSEQLYGALILASLVSLIVGLLIPGLIYLSLDKLNIPIPSLFFGCMSSENGGGTILPVFLGSFITSLIVGRVNNLNRK